MVHGFHVILSTYGFWLPNDPRGSWSDFVRKWDLFQCGPATKVNTRRSVAANPHEPEKRLGPKQILSHPPVRLTGHQALAITQGFDRARLESKYILHACAILPDHAHLVIAPTPHPITHVVGHLKRRATQSVTSQNLWPTDRPLWSRGCWKVFLSTPHDVERSINYVESNPLKEGKPRQHWSFVTLYIPAPIQDGGTRSPGATR